MFSSPPSTPATKYTFRFSFLKFRLIIFHWCTLGIAMFKMIYNSFWPLLGLSQCTYDEYVNKMAPMRVETALKIQHICELVSLAQTDRAKRTCVFSPLFKGASV